MAVWPPADAVLFASPLAAVAPITRSLVALATVTELELLLPELPTTVPIGVIWFTPVKLIAVAATVVLLLSVTTTLALPTFGLSRYQMLVSLLLAEPACWITFVNATPP